MIRYKIPCEIYSRVSGYFRPVNQWNKGKREEFNNRKFVKMKGAYEKSNNSNLAVDGIDEPDPAA